MGMSIFSNSYSSYDNDSGKDTKILPNPNPYNFEIEKYVKNSNSDYLLVMVNYPDCTNYEGRKFLVFKGIDISNIIEQGHIDPHFSENTNFHSPVARFEPTDRGWKMALNFIEAMR